MKLRKHITNWREWKKSTKAIVCGVFLLFIIIAVTLPNTFYGGTTQITSAEQLISIATQSKNKSLTEEYVLTTNIDLSGKEFEGIGSKEFPFQGTFDGNGHTISGLGVLQSQNTNAIQSGLFVYTDDAIVKDITVDGAKVTSDLGGGIVAVEAENTTFLNVVVSNSTLAITLNQDVSKDASLSAAFAGGIVGYSKGCALYNCEVNNTSIGTNSTGVTANVGDGFYYGGLVGMADAATLIEYSRMVDGEVEVSVASDVAVLDRTIIHNGGVAGAMQAGSWAIDCFSSADLITDVNLSMATTVGVKNHFGGIVATMYGDDCGITRCHYSGKQNGFMENTATGSQVILYTSGICGYSSPQTVSNVSYTYYDSDTLMKDEAGNARDIVLCALRNTNGANRNESENVKRIEYDYYTDEASFETYDFVGSVVVNHKNNSTFTNSTAFEKLEDLLASEGIRHVNKWIIDETAHMPAHGTSFGARLDFPGAGSVTISETKRADGATLHSAITTDSVSASARQYRRFGDTGTVNLVANVNSGYRLAGWYRNEDWYSSPAYTDMAGWKDLVNTTPASTSTTYAAPASDDDFYLAHFEAKVTYLPLNGGTEYASAYYDYMDVLNVDVNNSSAYDTATNRAKEAAKASGTFFAGWTTEVGGKAAASLADLYTITLYQKNTVVTETLTLYPVFLADPSEIVFTTIEAGTSNPVSFTMNGNTIATYGNATRALEQYSSSITYTANVDFAYDNTGTLVGTLSLKDSSGNTVTDDSIWEESGYRFLGWYEYEVSSGGQIVTDANGNKNAVRISRDIVTTLPGSSSLSGVKVYEARFEYEVEYWAEYDKIEYIFHTGYVYASEWYEYGENFVDLNAPFHVKENPNGWFTGVAGDLNAQKSALATYAQNAGTGYEGDPFNGGGSRLTNETVITEPIYAFSDYESANSNFTILTMTDFPRASATLTNDGATTSVTLQTSENEGYHFWGWTQQHVDAGGSNLAESGHFYESQASNWAAWKTSDFYWKHRVWALVMNEYIYTAHYYADVDFIKKDGSSETVYRRYQEEVFLDTDKTNIVYGLWDNDIDPNTTLSISDGAHTDLLDDSQDYGYASSQSAITIGASPSDADMAIKGYKFLGWIDASEIGYVDGASYENQSYMYRYIYDSPWDSFVTTDEDRVQGFLWKGTEDIKVTETMTLLPVYTYDFTVSVESSIGSQNAYLDYRIKRNTANTGFDVYLGAVAYEGNTIDLTNYQFKGWYDTNGGKVTDTLGDFTSSDAADFTISDDGDVTGDKRAYTFRANFDIRITFHDAGTGYADDIEYVVKDKVLGNIISTKKPVETPDDSYFIGWTGIVPISPSKGKYSNGDYHVISDLSGQYGLNQYEATGNGGGLADYLYTGSEIVQAPMDLYPVYIHLDEITDNIDVSSNMTSDTTTKLGLDTSGLYLETAYADENYMLVDWKYSEDGSDYEFYTTLEEGATKYYIPMPTLAELLKQSAGVTDYYRADYGFKINYYNIAGNLLFSHGLLSEDSLVSTNGSGSIEYYKDVPLDVMDQYLVELGGRTNTVYFLNRVYTMDGSAKKTLEAYTDEKITESLSFYMDLYQIYAMDETHGLCSPDVYKIGFTNITDGLNTYLLDDYTLDEYSEFHIGFGELNYGSGYPAGQNSIPVNLYLQKASDSGIEYGLYQTSTTANHTGPIADGVTTTESDGIAAFDIYGTIQLHMDEVDGYIKGETFFLTLRPANSTVTEMKVAIQPGETITVTELDFGDWTIEQDTKWSWRYDLLTHINGTTVTVDSVWVDGDVVTFDNKRNDDLSFTDEENAQK